MSIRNAYFQNLLLPEAKAADVRQALCQWHAAQGYQQVFGRRLFDYRDFSRGEKRAFVLSNEKWCVVLHSSDTEAGAGMHCAFAQFPALVQLWANGDAWGYRLEERGSRVTAYCSKQVADRAGECPPREPSDVQRLTAVCGVPNALQRIQRLEKAHFLFVQKACAEFADALEVPVAVSSFFDADPANAGMTEERRARGWNCQLLAFERAPGAAPDPIPKLWTGTLTAEQRAEIVRRRGVAPKRIAWHRLLLTIAIGLPRGLLTCGELIFQIGLWLITIAPGVRPILLGKATVFCDGFWKELQPPEPQRIQFRGDRAINTRHGCSIASSPPVQVLSKFQARKPIPGHEAVFDIKVESLFIYCMAYPKGGRIRDGGDALEERSFAMGDYTVDFVKRRFGRGEHEHYGYEWTIHSPRAEYQFSSWNKKEITSVQLETLENIVRSFIQLSILTF